MYVRLAGLFLLSLFLVSSPRSAAADLGKCEAKLLKSASKLGINISKSLQKCASSARKSIAGTGAVDSVAADTCEKNLAKIFNIGGEAGKGLVNKTLKSFDKLFVAGGEVCTSADLVTLGLLESGVNAPGVAAQDFVASWLVMRETQLAITEVAGVSGDFQELLDGMLEITDCGVERPNLCTFGAEQNPDCVVQTCNLSSSSKLQLLPANLSASLQDHPIAVQVCRAPGTLLDLPVDFSDDFRMLALGMASRIGPTSLPVANGTLCIDQKSASGWCDCAGAAVPFEPTTCRDHIANDDGGTCSESGGFCLVDDDCPDRNDLCSAAGIDDCGADLADASLESTCVRAGTDAGDCQAAPGRCIDEESFGRCHSGTFRGAPTLGYAGSSGAGDCMMQQTISLRLLPPAVCANGSGFALGTCTTTCAGPGACAADVACTGLGGTQCLAPTGPDGVACTRDDLGAPGASTALALTTGTVTAQLRDRILTSGTCSGAAVNSGMNCVTDRDCNGGVCNGEVIQPPQAAVTATGAGLACKQFDSGNLSGLTLVGSFALIDGFGSIGDQNAIFTLDCD